eukprot:CAMPEP_0113515072 /NCGR_PEP_ID=MMETSP0014_2-20120614/40743_1 /TAXON_ID=2857 /ORGANISM="Nitzschia sp." /LENGTH=1154 /DNA_ID=CAMNT_0000411603 /DNA_START=713 /DNA_END=4178 /DNA_ORIENTATION=- /assembly_acc=CAM_ASM_000159
MEEEQQNRPDDAADASAAAAAAAVVVADRILGVTIGDDFVPLGDDLAVEDLPRANNASMQEQNTPEDEAAAVVARPDTSAAAEINNFRGLNPESQKGGGDDVVCFDDIVLEDRPPTIRETDFEDLPRDVRRSLLYLGWTASSWNANGHVPILDKEWNELTRMETVCCSDLGWTTQRLWNKFRTDGPRILHDCDCIRHSINNSSTTGLRIAQENSGNDGENQDVEDRQGHHDDNDDDSVESAETVDSFWSDPLPEGYTYLYEQVGSVYPCLPHSNLDTMVYAGRRNNQCHLQRRWYVDYSQYIDEDIQWSWIEKEKLLSDTSVYQRTLVDHFDGVVDMKVVDKKVFGPDWVSVIGATDGTSGYGTINLYKFDEYVGLHLVDLWYHNPTMPFPIHIPIFWSEGRYDPVVDCYRRSTFLYNRRYDRRYDRRDRHHVIFFMETATFQHQEVMIYFENKQTRERFRGQLRRRFQKRLKSMKEFSEELWNHLVSNGCLEPNVEIGRINRNDMISFIESYMEVIAKDFFFELCTKNNDVVEYIEAMFRRSRWNDDGLLINAVFDRPCWNEDAELPNLPNPNGIEILTIRSLVWFTRQSFYVIEGLRSLRHLKIMNVDPYNFFIDFPKDTPLRLKGLKVLTLSLGELFSDDITFQPDVFRMLENMDLPDLEEVNIINENGRERDLCLSVKKALDALGHLTISRCRFKFHHHPDYPEDLHPDEISKLLFCVLLFSVGPNTESITVGDNVTLDRPYDYSDGRISFDVSASSAMKLTASLVRQLEEHEFHPNFGETIGRHLSELKIRHIYCTNSTNHKENVLKLLHWFPLLHDFGTDKQNRGCGDDALSEINQILNYNVKYMTKINRPWDGLRSLLSPEMATNITVSPDLVSKSPFISGREQRIPKPIPLSYWPKILEKNNDDPAVVFSALRIRSKLEGLGPAASVVVGGVDYYPDRKDSHDKGWGFPERGQSALRTPQGSVDLSHQTPRSPSSWMPPRDRHADVLSSHGSPATDTAPVQPRRHIRHLFQRAIKAVTSPLSSNTSAVDSPSRPGSRFVSRFRRIRSPSRSNAVASPSRRGSRLLSRFNRVRSPSRSNAVASPSRSGSRLVSRFNRVRSPSNRNTPRPGHNIIVPGQFDDASEDGIVHDPPLLSVRTDNLCSRSGR